MKIYLNISFKEKDEVKELARQNGTRILWDAENKKWYFEGESLPEFLQKYSDAQQQEKYDYYYIVYPSDGARNWFKVVDGPFTSKDVLKRGILSHIHDEDNMTLEYCRIVKSRKKVGCGKSIHREWIDVSNTLEDSVDKEIQDAFAVRMSQERLRRSEMEQELQQEHQLRIEQRLEPHRDFLDWMEKQLSKRVKGSSFRKWRQSFGNALVSFKSEDGQETYLKSLNKGGLRIYAICPFSEEPIPLTGNRDNFLSAYVQAITDRRGVAKYILETSPELCEKFAQFARATGIFALED